MADWSYYFNRTLHAMVANRFTYGIYGKVLWRQIKDGPKPEHIAVILDGNRRWALEHTLPSFFGHSSGADKVEDFLEWCRQLGIKTVTLYVFSTENFQRSPNEVNEIMKIADEKFRKVLEDENVRKNQIHVKALGRIDQLPKTTQQLIRKAEDSTKDYDKFYLNIAIAYGGRAEIVDAVKEIAEEVNEGQIQPSAVDEKLIEKHLYTSHLPKSDPDLIIRTSGEERLSNFLLWQGAYSELSFLDVFWPDFRQIDLWRAIRTYQQRMRRYGK
jgi:tritrans,polycis-undecaprenyl-diphosphate synthase [geranylgeranyl-diphosphate specific]